MSVVPKKQLEKLQWAIAHVEPFNTNAVAIGTTVLEAAAFETRTDAANAAMTAAVAAHTASRDATLALKVALAELDIAAAGIVKQVRAKAETTGNLGVYTLASIPEPATPTPCGELTQPGLFKAFLDETGELKLTWKCTQPVAASGVGYEVWRRIGNTGSFVCLGRSGRKEFVDATIPGGTAQVTYKIRANRSTSVSPWAQFVVNFGMESGSMVASISAPKIAA